jgi:hypothetical protein
MLSVKSLCGEELSIFCRLTFEVMGKPSRELEAACFLQPMMSLAGGPTEVPATDMPWLFLLISFRELIGGLF